MVYSIAQTVDKLGAGCYAQHHFSLFARHGRALTGVSPEHAQIVGSV